MTLIHGGNVYEIASQLGCTPEDVLDYSASINPLGPPAGLLDLFNHTFHRLQHYPDIWNRALVDATAHYHGVSPDRVVVGNGSTELIYWLPRVLGIRKALIVLPTFAEYQKAFELQGVQLARLISSPENDFQPVVEQLEELCERFAPEAILCTHPGSPAGTLMPPEVRAWLVEWSRRRKIFVIVDEVFIDFCEEESLKDSLGESERVILIRSMTKFYGLPGLRLGYLLTSPDLAGRLGRFLPPWAVNTYAQVAGPYCFAQREYRERTLALIQEERGRMADRIQAFGGCRVFPGRANYLLMQLGESLAPAAQLQQDLLASERILVRNCQSFEGLDDRYVRVAIRLPEQNERLIAALEAWVLGQR